MTPLQRPIWHRFRKWLGLLLLVLAACTPVTPVFTKAELQQDQLALAWAKLYFGYSQQQVNFVSQRDAQIKCLRCFVQSQTTIGDLNVNMTLRYFEQRLYRLFIYTDGVLPGARGNKLERDRDQLLSLIKARQGQPSTSFSFDLREIEPGDIRYSDLWDEPQNPVRYAVGIGRYEKEYYAVLLLEYKPLLAAYERFVAGRR